MRYCLRSYAIVCDVNAINHGCHCYVRSVKLSMRQQAAPNTWKCLACGNKTYNSSDECSGCGREREVPRNQTKVLNDLLTDLFDRTAHQPLFVHCCLPTQHYCPLTIVSMCTSPFFLAHDLLSQPQYTLDINTCTADDAFQACLVRFHFSINHLFQHAGIRVIVDHGKLTLERDAPAILTAARGRHHSGLKRLVSLLAGRNEWGLYIKVYAFV